MWNHNRTTILSQSHKLTPGGKGFFKLDVSYHKNWSTLIPRRWYTVSGSRYHRTSSYWSHFIFCLLNEEHAPSDFNLNYFIFLYLYLLTWDRRIQWSLLKYKIWSRWYSLRVTGFCFFTLWQFHSPQPGSRWGTRYHSSHILPFIFARLFGKLIVYEWQTKLPYFLSRLSLPPVLESEKFFRSDKYHTSRYLLDWIT